jgi:hypothetical protein
MTQPTVAAAGGQHLLPPRTLPSGNSSQPPPASSNTVPAGTTAPVFHPWVQVVANAESRVKTEVQADLREYDKTVTDAGRLLDAARAIATEQAKQLEAAAWVAWNSRMAEAREIYDAVMAPALVAYTDATNAAHTRLRHQLGKANDAYKRILEDTTWAQQITNPPSSSM